MSAKVPTPRRVIPKAAEAVAATVATTVTATASATPTAAAATKTDAVVTPVTVAATTAAADTTATTTTTTTAESVKKVKATKKTTAVEAEDTKAAGASETAETADSGADAVGDEDREHRTQLLKILDIVISPARCGTHLKKDLHDGELEAELTAAAAELAASPSEAAKARHAAAHAAAHAKRIRIGQTAPIAVAATWHQALMDLVSAGIKAALAADNKSVSVSDLHAATDVKYAGLYKACPIWAGYDAKAEAAKAEAAKATAKAKAPSGEAAEGAASDADEVDESDGETKTAKGKTSFSTYVENAIKSVKKRDNVKVRVMRPVREHLATLVAEGIKLHADIAQTIVKGPKGGKGGARTFTSDHVKTVNSICLVGDAAAAASLSAFVDSKIVEFEGHRAAEAAKKLEAMTPEQKAERAAKEKEAAAKKLAADVMAADKALAAAKARVEAAAAAKAAVAV